ncbi:MAG: hypothetical protein HUJ53_07525, partial [Holdemanella sp.]|nr:hypothetical protein [Holdemanella sp.]
VVPLTGFKVEPETDRTETSTDAVLTDEQVNYTLLKYPTMVELGLNRVTADNSFPIPGLIATKTLESNDSNEFSMCTSMTPQGICRTSKYIFISAYCHTKSHNSVLYMIDGNTNTFIKEIILPDKPHAGNICYDPVNNNIWVACTGKGFVTGKRTAYLNCLNLNTIEAYDFNTSKKPIVFDMKYEIEGFRNASFISYYRGNIFVGNYRNNDKENSYVQRFPITDEGGLETKPVKQALKTKQIASGREMAVIDKFCQGIFLEEGTLVMTQSTGNAKSKITVFYESDYETSINEMTDLEYQYKAYLQNKEVLETYPGLIKSKKNLLDEIDEMISDETDSLKRDQYKKQRDTLAEEIENLEVILKIETEANITFDLDAYKEKYNKEVVYSLEDKNADDIFELPPRLEQVFASTYNDCLYLLFESGAHAYKNQFGADAIDRILIVNADVDPSDTIYYYDGTDYYEGEITYQ